MYHMITTLRLIIPYQEGFESLESDAIGYIALKNYRWRNLLSRKTGYDESPASAGSSDDMIIHVWNRFLPSHFKIPIEPFSIKI